MFAVLFKNSLNKNNFMMKLQTFNNFNLLSVISFFTSCDKDEDLMVDVQTFSNKF